MDVTRPHEPSGGEWTVVSVVSAVVGGVVLTAGTALLVVVVTSSALAGALLAPLFGGVGAGYLSRGTPAIGGVVGFAVGALLGLVVLANVVVWSYAAAPATGGAGLAIWVLLGLLAVACTLATVLTAVGGVLGALAR